MPPPATTIGILHPGEMGAALGALLHGRGHRLLWCADGRSAASRRRAAHAGFEDAGSLAALAARADWVLSLVPPGAALATARAFAAALPDDRAPLFADLNSISPQTTVRIAAALGARRVRFVDGSLHGQAGRLREQAVLFLSGPAAPALASLFGDALATRVLGEELGAASRMKMLLSCVSKSLVALFLEVRAAAEAAGDGDAFQEAATRFYPELVTAFERMAPTYPRHAARRATELAEAEATLRALGCEPRVAAASRRTIEAVAAAGLPADAPRGAAPSRLPELVAALSAARPHERALPTQPTPSTED